MGIIRFALKSTIAGSVVYLTINEGVWSNAEETMKMYSRMYNTIAPYVQKNIPQDIAKEVADLPSLSTMTNCARGMYNNGVMASVKFLTEVPTYISNGIDSVMSSTEVKSILNGPPTDKKAQ